MSPRFKPGDVVVYHKQKNSVHPGPNARDIHPAPHGDFYYYTVDKFWRVTAVGPNNVLVVRTRRGKQHELVANDPALRRARWWEWLLFRHRFPQWTPPDQPSA